MNLDLNEIKEIFIEIASTSEILDDYGLENIEQLAKELSIDDIYSDYVYYFSGETERYIVDLVQNSGGEGDGARMYATFSIKDIETSEYQYVQFSGRYSSWGSSSFTGFYFVSPEVVEVVKYNRI